MQPGGPLSPTQLPAPTVASQGFELPPNKRQRFSPDLPAPSPSAYPAQSPTTFSAQSPAAYPTQSPAPYQHKSPYAMSPGTTTPGSATASPHFATNNLSLPANSFPNHNTYTTPYGNGTPTPSPSTPTNNPPNNNQTYNSSYPQLSQVPQNQNLQPNGSVSGSSLIRRSIMKMCYMSQARSFFTISGLLQAPGSISLN